MQDLKGKNIDWSLYAILDKEFLRNRAIGVLAEDVISGGAGIIQVRNKISTPIEFYENVLEVKEVTQHYRIPLIVNDRLDIALAAKADGVHLGQKDLPFSHARKLLGDQRLLGASVHTVAEFDLAMEGQPDYLGVGTIFQSKTKSDLKTSGVQFLKIVRTLTNLPLIAIGGITLENAGKVFESGADGVAVVSSLLDTDDVRKRADDFVKRIKHKKIC